MILCKIEAPVLAAAMEDSLYPMLNLYLRDYYREEERVFVSYITPNKYTGEMEVEFRNSLQDFFCNEDVECNRLLQLAKEMGHLNENDEPIISNKIIKTIEL